MPAATCPSLSSIFVKIRYYWFLSIYPKVFNFRGFPVETEIWKCEWRLLLCDFLTSHVMAYFVPHAWYRNPWLLNGLRWDAFQCRAEWGGFDILSSHLPCVQPVVSASIEVQTGEGIPTPVYFKVVSSCILLDFCGLCALGYLIECIYI